MAVLDTPQFPHILTAVLSFSAWETLTTLRLTSKCVRAAVDRLQCSHMVLTPSAVSPTAVTVRAPGKVRIPALKSCCPLSWAQQPAHPLAALVAKTRVVDIVGFIPPACNLALLAPHFTALDTLRMPTSPKDDGYTPYFPLPCKTLVLFTNGDAVPNPGLLDDFHLDDFDDDGEMPLLPEGVRPSIPAGATTVVVNMKGTDIPIADVHAAIMDAPASVADIIVILPQYRGRHSAGVIRRGEMVEEIITMDLAELILANDTATFTLVGFDRVSAGFPARVRGLLTDNMRAYNVKGIDQPGDNAIVCNGPFGPGPARVAQTTFRPEKEEWIEHVLAKVSFKTLAEYLQTAARAGDDGIDYVEHL